MLFGRNPMAGLLLGMLNLEEQDVGRFRDCFLKKVECEGEEDSYKIIVFTRNGGGNRPDYAEVTEKLQAHPEFITDYDNDVDRTYATYEFKVPEAFKETAKELFELGAGDVDPSQKWRELFKKLEEGDQNNPAVKKALEVGKRITEAMNSGEKIVKL